MFECFLELFYDRIHKAGCDICSWEVLWLDKYLITWASKSATQQEEFITDSQKERDKS